VKIYIYGVECHGRGERHVRECVKEVRELTMYVKMYMQFTSLPFLVIETRCQYIYITSLRFHCTLLVLVREMLLHEPI
jgi:hypothetical protein